MRTRSQQQPLPRRAMVEPVAPLLSSTPHIAWAPLRLDTSVELLERADVIIMQGQEFLVASILPVVHGVLALDLAPVYSWRNGGEWPRYRYREVPRFTTVESLALARGLAPTAACYLPELSWRRVLQPRVLEHGRAISLTDAFARVPRDAGPRGAAVARVDEIRALYGRMLSDISYRIENSALFDSTVPTTRQFETALALWSDGWRGIPDDEVVRRSGAVVVAFGAARSHAETVGLDHLPSTARDTARRAAGAARLARSSTSDAERKSAHRRVVSILHSLALDHLPDPAALPRAITTGTPKA